MARFARRLRVGTGNLDKEVEEEFGGIIEAASITPAAAAAAAEEAWGCAEPHPEDSPGIGVSAAGAVANASSSDAELAERAAQAIILREMIGNPFRPTAVDPSWLAWNDGTVVKLAQAIYDDRAFDRLPVLAEALEEAGCDNADILNHCRQPGEHVRGCWAVDLILGRE